MPASVDADRPEQRIVEAAAVLPRVGGVTGWAALRWYGAGWFDGLSPDGRSLIDVDLATCYQDIRSQPGFAVCQERLGPDEIETLDGVPVTRAVRSLLFSMRYAGSDRDAVVCADMAAYSDVVSIAEASAYALAHPGWTGVPQARRALVLADENSWSPWETRMRLVWVLDAGLPTPLTNRPVFDRDGQHIGTPDLLDVEAGVAGEFDGALHLEGRQRAVDSARVDRFRDVGLETITALAPDVVERRHLAARIEAARTRARWEAQSRRAWTIDPPAWWRPTWTVEQRRSLDVPARRAWLAHRRPAA